MLIDWLQNMNLELISSLGAFIAAFAAAVALIQQSRLTRLSIGTELLWTLEERFVSDITLKGCRQTASSALLEGQTVLEIDIVFDFFESVGSYMRAGLMSDRVVWSMFFSRAFGYWNAGQEHISQVRLNDRTIWMDYDYLIRKLVKVEARERKVARKKVVMSSEDMRKFLEDESFLSDVISGINSTDRKKEVEIGLSKSLPNKMIMFLVGLVTGLVIRRPK